MENNKGGKELGRSFSPFATKHNIVNFPICLGVFLRTRGSNLGP